MVTPRRPEIIMALRQRLLRALQLRVLMPGDRLPGTRTLAHEFGADPRVVAAAYRVLADEGLVELRARAGAFLHPGLVGPQAGQASVGWLAEVLVAGIARGIAAPALPALLRRALGRTPVPVAVIATTVDQAVGMCRELEQSIGVAASPVLAETLPPLPANASAAACRAAMPRAVRRARVLVTTEAHAKRVAALAARLGKPSVGVSVRPELYETEWAVLRPLDVYVVVADRRFGTYVQAYLRDIGAEARVHVYVAGHDDVASIPGEAPVYLTQAARERLGTLRLPGGVLPTARMLADDCLVELVRAVLEVVRADAGDGARPAAPSHEPDDA